MTLYQIDAFTDQLFAGNPAAVCPLSEWLPDELLQQIAAENNLSETAFFVPQDQGFRLRWFTPAVEVDLCGHATLASAHVLFQHLDYPQNKIHFYTRSGELIVEQQGEQYVMDFPADQLTACAPPPEALEALQITPEDCYYGREDYLLIVEDQQTLAQINPDFRQLKALESRGVIVSAPGEEVDFVSRCFFPLAGIDEDPVTGSAHTTMAPYWSKRLGKNRLIGQQISKRGGTVYCQMREDRVLLAGQAQTYLIGKLQLD